MLPPRLSLDSLRAAALCAGLLAGASGCITTVEERLADGSVKTSRYYPWNAPDKDGNKPSSQLSLSWGQLMEQQGNATEARDWYEKALRQNPRSVDAVVGLARLDSHAGRTEDARKRLLEAEKMDPKSPTMHAAFAQFHADRDEFPEAMSRFQQALSIAPDNQSIRTQYAQALAHAGNYDQSFAQFSQAVGEPAAHYNLGLIYYEEQRLVLAEEQFVQALTKNPKLTQAQTWLDSVRKEQEQIAQAPARNAYPVTAAAGQRRPLGPGATGGSGPVISAGPTVGPAGYAAQSAAAAPSATLPQVAPAGALPVAATQSSGAATPPGAVLPASGTGLPLGSQVIHAPSAQPAAPAPVAIPQPPPGLTPAQLEQWNNQFRNP